MSFWSGLLSTVAPIVGSMVAGPLGGAAGSVLSGLSAKEQKNQYYKNMFGQLASSGIGALGSYFSQQDSQNQQNAMMDKQFEQAKSLAQYQAVLSQQAVDAQNQWNLAQWNRENEYNSPAQQLKRLKEAGYNPALGGQMMQAGQLQSAPQTAPDVAGALGAVSSSGSAAASRLAQTRQSAIDEAALASQIRLNNSQAKKLDSETQGQNIDNRIKLLTQDSAVEFEGLKVVYQQKLNDLSDAQKREIIANTDKMIQETVNLRAQLDELDSRIANMDAQTKEVLQRCTQSEKEFEYVIRKYEDEHLLNDEQLKFVRANISSVYQTMRLVAEQIQGQQLTNSILTVDSQHSSEKYQIALGDFLNRSKTSELDNSAKTYELKYYEDNKGIVNGCRVASEFTSVIGSILGGASGMLKLFK